MQSLAQRPAHRGAPPGPPRRPTPRRAARAAPAAAHAPGSTAVLPPVVNWHLEPRCNYGCKFCFATFEEVKTLDAPTPSLSDMLRVPAMLAAAGASRITFVGGEPLLHPHIEELIGAAKRSGLFTSMVTNASLLDASKLLRLRPALDQIAISIDASNDDVHTALGRGVGGRAAGHLKHAMHVWSLAQELGFSMKLNTVVTRLNLHDDMTAVALALRPPRWKVFQVLPIEGQNDGSVTDLLITEDEFHAWVGRHRAALLAAEAAGQGGEQAAPIQLVAEDNSAMRGSYAMLDAYCRFYSNLEAGHEYGPGLFSADVPAGREVQAAWGAVQHGFSAHGFLGRGGVYDWGQSPEERARQEGRMEAASKERGGIR